MKSWLLFVLMILSLVLAGCSSAPVNKLKSWSPWHSSSSKNDSQPSHAKSGELNGSLIKQTAQSAVKLNKQANAAQQAANPPKDVSEPPPPSSYGMNIPVSVRWNGPVKPILKDLTKKVNYKLHILGHPPNMPIVVNVYEKNTSVGEVIRNIGLQCGDKAQVVVLPHQQTVELRYQTQG